MKNYYFFLVLLCSLTSILCTEPKDMLGAFTQNCSIDESEHVQFEEIPEFKACKNWEAIKSITEISEDNKNDVRCLLYYESLISLCKEMKSTKELLNIMKTEPEVKGIEEVCKYFSINQSASHIIRNLIKTKVECVYLCSEYRYHKLVSKSICTKFYDYYKNSTQSQSPSNPVSAEVESEKPLLDFADTKNAKSEGVKIQDTVGVESQETVDVKNQGNANENKQDTIDVKSQVPISINNQETIGENLEDIVKNKVMETSIQHKIEENVIPTDIPNPGVDKKNSQETTGPKENEQINNPSKGNDSKPTNTIQSSLPNMLSSIDEKKEMNKGTDLETSINPEESIVNPVNEQQAPPTNTNLNGLSTGQGQESIYPDDGDYNMEPEKEQKPVNIPKEYAQNVNDDDSTQNKFKKPIVSPLSDRLEYNDDINGNSYFFSFFSFTCILLIVGYVLYHNKQKVLALLVEGRHGRRPQRVRRPNSANYHKLDSNLEEAISSSVSKNPSHVIY